GAVSGEGQMVAGSGSGGVDRIGGGGVERLLRRPATAVQRQALMRAYSEEGIRSWPNQRGRGGAWVSGGRSPGPESSIGKVHQGELNQRIQLLATALLGPAATAWTGEVP